MFFRKVLSSFGSAGFGCISRRQGDGPYGEVLSRCGPVSRGAVASCTGKGRSNKVQCRYVLGVVMSYDTSCW